MKLQIQFKRILSLLISFSLIYMPGSLASAQATAAYTSAYNAGLAEAQKANPSLTQAQYNTNLNALYAAVAAAQPKPATTTTTTATPATTAAPKFTPQQIENFKELETGYLEAVKKDTTLTREKFGSDLKGFKEAFDAIPSLSNNTWVANLFADGVSGTKDAGNIDTLIANAADPMTLFVQSQNKSSLSKVDQKKLEVTLEAQALLNNTMKYGAELGVLINAGKYDEAFKYANANGLNRVIVQADGLAAVGVKDMNATQMDAFFKAGGNNYGEVKNDLGAMFAGRKWEQNRNMDNRAGQNIRALGGSGLPDYAWFNSDSANKGSAWKRSTFATAVVTVAVAVAAYYAAPAIAGGLASAAGTTTAAAATAAGATVTSTQIAINVVANAAVGGISSVALGGKFVDGALLAGVATGVNQVIIPGAQEALGVSGLKGISGAAVNVVSQTASNEIVNVATGGKLGSATKDAFSGNIINAAVNNILKVPDNSTSNFPSIKEIASNTISNFIRNGGDVKDTFVDTGTDIATQTIIRTVDNKIASNQAAEIATKKEEARLAYEERAFTNGVKQALTEASLNVPTSVDGAIEEYATIAAQRTRDAALLKRSQVLVSNNLENNINQNLAPNLTANKNPVSDNINLVVTAGLSHQLDDKFDASLNLQTDVPDLKALLDSFTSRFRPNLISRYTNLPPSLQTIYRTSEISINLSADDFTKYLTNSQDSLLLTDLEKIAKSVQGLEQSDLAALDIYQANGDQDKINKILSHYNEVEQYKLNNPDGTTFSERALASDLSRPSANVIDCRGDQCVNMKTGELEVAQTIFQKNKTGLNIAREVAIWDRAFKEIGRDISNIFK